MEIIFKGTRVDNGCPIYGYLVITPILNKHLIFSGKTENINKNVTMWDFKEVVKESVQQFQGQLDENNQRIFVYVYEPKIEIPTLTELETKVLKAIIKDDFYRVGFVSGLWVDVFINDTLKRIDIDSKTARETLSSLVKKSCIKIFHIDDDQVLELNNTGKQFLIKENLVCVEGYEV